MLPPILGTRKRVPFSLQRKRGGKMNIRTTVYKLQKALLMQGRKIKINQIQAYSQKVGKMITKYIVIESRELEDGRTKTEILTGNLQHG